MSNTQEIVDKVEFYELNANPIMPEFPIPESFGTVDEYRKKFTEEHLKEEFGKSFDDLGGYEKTVRVKFEADYLQSLVYKGATERYGEEIDPDTLERINFELQVIKTMGFPGYFLIVQDFINAARKMALLLARAGDLQRVLWLPIPLGITNVDPLRYDLLFERFLNPDRISMPDIDIDFDDDGRQLVLDWVKRKIWQGPCCAHLHLWYHGG